MDIQPGESKSFLMPMPEGVKKGDLVQLELGWTCAACSKKYTRTYFVKVGDREPRLNFGCNCGSLIGRLKKLFGTARKL